jgi:hypothetical protein
MIIWELCWTLAVAWGRHIFYKANMTFRLLALLPFLDIGCDTDIFLSLFTLTLSVMVELSAGVLSTSQVCQPLDRVHSESGRYLPNNLLK